MCSGSAHKRCRINGGGCGPLVARVAVVEHEVWADKRLCTSPVEAETFRRVDVRLLVGLRALGR